MTQKFWSEMTHDEKLDVLRNDIERLFAAINSTNSNVSQLDRGMTELLTRVTALQKKDRQVPHRKSSHRQ
jgi:prefoldin subunit 5